jgi:hypothetical protein
MPTILRKDGFKFFFYANEHLPKHIHIVKGDNFAKVNLETLEVVINYFKGSELNKVIEIVRENRTLFMEKWYEYFQR